MVSATVSLTVNVACPDAFVVPDTVVIVDDPPPLASDTVLPEAALPLTSFRVTVMVEVVVPFAVTDPGDAETVDWAAVGRPGLNVTEAVCSTVVAPIVAVYV